jgi:hypothetical protein
LGIPLHLPDSLNIPEIQGQIEAHVLEGKGASVPERPPVVSLEEKFPVGTDCHLTIFLGGRKSRQRIKLRGKVVRAEERGMAFTFHEIMGSDSFAHLRTLILYNSPEARCVEKEFKTHLGIKRLK